VFVVIIPAPSSPNGSPLKFCFKWK